VRISPTEKLDASRRLDLAFEALEKDGFLSRESRNWSEGAETASNVTFLHDPLDPEDGTRVGDHLHEILRSARSSILIESPYFVPSRSLRGLLVEKIAEGVEITVLTNSLRSTDGLLPQAAYLRYRRGLARAGIRFHEYKGPDPLHAKSIVIDERIAMIGSYNIDPRSRYLNTEVICAIDDEALARELTASIETHMAHAWAIQHTTRGPRLSRAMTFRLWAAKLLVPLIEPQL
jgi:putative cardiolipin synthase